METARPKLVLFEWDYHNLRKLERAGRAITPLNIAEMFGRSETRVIDQRVEGISPSNPISTGEMRFIAFGYDNLGRFLRVVFSNRQNHVRCITAWKTTPEEAGKAGIRDFGFPFETDPEAG
jgi:uncharacterized DUF497 family protein